MAADKRTLYGELAEQLAALIAGESDLIANTANMAALIYHGLPDLNWAGFYFARPRIAALPSPASPPPYPPPLAGEGQHGGASPSPFPAPQAWEGQGAGEGGSQTDRAPPVVPSPASGGGLGWGWSTVAHCAHERELVLGPFQGRPACVRIPWGKGVCGTAAARGAAIVVPDVHQFPGHIACDAASRSELVVPLVAAGGVVGVLDLDSPVLSRFDEDDRAGCVRLVAILLAQHRPELRLTPRQHRRNIPGR